MTELEIFRSQKDGMVQNPGKLDIHFFQRPKIFFAPTASQWPPCV
jgi:hypothetical protein